jgi:flagellar biogenesis protein FliO
MQRGSNSRPARRGITVLSLLLLIIAVVIAAIFLVRYLRNRPAASLHQPLDQLNLAGVVQVVRGDAVNLLRVGPHSARRAET